MLALHPCSWWRDHEQALALYQERVLASINEAFVRWDQPAEVFYEGFQVVDVMGTSRQQRKLRNHAHAGDTQTELEAIVVHILSGAVAIVGIRFQTAITPAAGVATDRQGQRIDGLDGILGLPTDVRQALLDGRFDLPQVGRLSDKPCAVAQGGKERAIMGAEVLPNIFV